MLKELKDKIYHRGPYCAYIGIRLSGWDFLVLIVLKSKAEVSQVLWQRDLTKYLRLSYITFKKLTLPSYSIRKELCR